MPLSRRARPWVAGALALTAVALVAVAVRWASEGPNTSCLVGGGTRVEAAACVALDVFAQLTFVWMILGPPAALLVWLWTSWLGGRGAGRPPQRGDGSG